MLLAFWKRESWENVGERTCVCHQFIFAPPMTKQSSCGTIGRRPPMLRDRLGGEIQPVRGLTVLDRFFRVHFDASRGCGPITAPLSYFANHSARWRTVSSPGVNDTPLWHQYLHLHLHPNHYDHHSNYCHATACHEGPIATSTKLPRDSKCPQPYPAAAFVAALMTPSSTSQAAKLPLPSCS
jgi:hypothetical protein